VDKIDGNRVTVKVDLYGGEEICAKGEVVAVAVTDKWINKWIDLSKYSGVS
jgi:acyl-CoA thioesterase FadM